MIPNYLEMSREDQERVTCAQEILDLSDTQVCLDRIAKDGELEKTRLEFIDRLDTLGITLEKQY